MNREFIAREILEVAKVLINAKDSEAPKKIRKRPLTPVRFYKALETLFTDINEFNPKTRKGHQFIFSDGSEIFLKNKAVSGFMTSWRKRKMDSLLSRLNLESKLRYF